MKNTNNKKDIPTLYQEMNAIDEYIIKINHEKDKVTKKVKKLRSLDHLDEYIDFVSELDDKAEYLENKKRKKMEEIIKRTPIAKIDLLGDPYIKEEDIMDGSNQAHLYISLKYGNITTFEKEFENVTQTVTISQCEKYLGKKQSLSENTFDKKHTKKRRTYK